MATLQFFFFFFTLLLLFFPGSHVRLHNKHGTTADVRHNVNAGGGAAAFSCRINMKNADPGGNEKPCEVNQHMVAFKHGITLPGQRTLDLGRVRTTSIQLSRLHVCQKEGRKKKAQCTHSL